MTITRTRWCGVATVYPVRGSLTKDPTKRGGRWESDFVWNSNWKEAMDFEERQREKAKEASSAAVDNNEGRAAAGGGGEKVETGKLSLMAAKIDLNDVNVDLSDQLKPKKGIDGESLPGVPVIPVSRPKKGQRGADAGARRQGYAANPSTKKEAKSWSRGGRYARRSAPPAASEEEEVKATSELELARYNQLKLELQLWSLGLTAVCLASTFVFYGRDVAASYAIGSLGGLLYLRSLSRSMDAFGVGGVGGGPRLVIPVILALVYNRYNTLVAESSGIHLDLLPMLVGFFTYKGAVIGRQSLALFDDLASGYQNSGMGDESAGGGGDTGDTNATTEDGGQTTTSKDVSSVDRAFTRNMLIK